MVKKIMLILNIAVVCAMLIFIGVQWYIIETVPGNSAPGSVSLFYSVHFLVPLAIVDVFYLIFSKKHKK